MENFLEVISRVFRKPTERPLQIPPLANTPPEESTAQTNVSETEVLQLDPSASANPSLPIVQVHSLTSESFECAVKTVPPVSLECFSLRVPKIVAKVTSEKFIEQPPFTPKATDRPKHAATPKPVKKPPVKHVAPPPGVPIRERLRSVLQPPIATLLGDNRVTLPFAPFPYQYEGIQFLFGRWSAIIGDEMGLGKTMQTILSLRLLLRAGSIRSVLLCCPKPLVTNWQREFDLWAGEIPMTVVTGSSEVRKNCWLHDPSPVKLTNYETLTRDAELLTSGHISFDLVVLDEAQKIKNRESRTAEVVHKLKRNRSWALTGTPVENRAADLVSLLEFVNNGRKPHVEQPGVLREEVANVLLRRTKEMVFDDMPPRLIRDLYIDLSENQRLRYDQAEREGVCRLDGMGDEITIEHVFELIRWLKMICNFDPTTGESSKAEHVLASMEEIAQSGKKAILFSQYVTTLERLKGILGEYSPLVYHGKIPQKEREKVLKEFKERDDRPLLMLSYATGAVGLNLQFTNYVFLYDRWWNPAIEDQAINRAHRIGQKEPVFVFRYISPGTIEERIARVLEQKRDLFADLIDGLDPADSGLTREEVFGFFNLQIRQKAA